MASIKQDKRNWRVYASVFSALIAYFACVRRTIIERSPQLKIGKLANGLTYYIQKNGAVGDPISMKLVVNTGAIMEDDDQKGLAHFVEHMAFNGSSHFKKQALISFLESLGMKIGANINASTGFDATIYKLAIPSNQPKDTLERALVVLSDWAGGISFDPEMMEKERANMAQLKRFYTDWYRPDLMAVIVVGGIDPDQTEQLIQRHFENLSNPADARAREYARVPVRNQPAALVATDPEASQNRLSILYARHAQEDDQSTAWFAERVLDRVLSSMLNERLKELARLPNPPFRANAGQWREGGIEADLV